MALEGFSRFSGRFPSLFTSLPPKRAISEQFQSSFRAVSHEFLQDWGGTRYVNGHLVSEQFPGNRPIFACGGD